MVKRPPTKKSFKIYAVSSDSKNSWSASSTNGRILRCKEDMKYNPDKHHRRSIRLKGYDYSSKGMYYITLCVNKRLCLFGDIEDGEMKLNDAGKIVDRIWQEIPKYYPFVEIDEHTLMPNHLHGIIILNNENVGAPPCGRPLMNPDNGQAQGPANGKYGQAQGPAPTVKRLSLGDVVGRFESFTMYQYILGIKNHQWKPFHKKLWQRNYYEHIIRNENELNKIRKYIIDNPLNWEADEENPKNWICRGEAL